MKIDAIDNAIKAQIESLLDLGQDIAFVLQVMRQEHVPFLQRNIAHDRLKMIRDTVKEFAFRTGTQDLYTNGNDERYEVIIQTARTKA